jgi:hypothetical protein
MRAEDLQERPPTHPSAAHVATDVVIASAWVAICAASPEFIWRGAFVVISHAQWGDLISVVFIGVILAFFIEPAVQRLRHLPRHGTKNPEVGDRSYRLLFPALAGLALAFASVAIHDSIRAFVSDPNSGQAAPHFGFEIGISAAFRIADAWTFVPFCISLAWLTMRRKYLREPLAVIAAISPGLAAWWFSWPTVTFITTWLPALAILAVGYRQWSKGPVALFHRRCAMSVAWIAPTLLGAAVVFDWIIRLLHLDWPPLYDWESFGEDARFYLGWMIGLLLAPVPLIETVRRSRSWTKGQSSTGGRSKLHEVPHEAGAHNEPAEEPPAAP